MGGNDFYPYSYRVIRDLTPSGRHKKFSTLKLKHNIHQSLENFIYKHNIDLKNVQSWEGKREFKRCHISTN